MDVTIIPDEKLKLNIITAPYQILAKHIRDNDLLPVLKDLAETGILAKNAKIGNEKLFVDVLYSALSTGEISDREAFEDLLLSQPEEVRKPFMSILELYAQERSQQAAQQALQQGITLIAKKLLAEGMSAQKVVELTGLTLETVKRLQPLERQVN